MVYYCFSIVFPTLLYLLGKVGQLKISTATRVPDCQPEIVGLWLCPTNHETAICVAELLQKLGIWDSFSQQMLDEHLEI